MKTDRNAHDDYLSSKIQTSAWTLLGCRQMTLALLALAGVGPVILSGCGSAKQPWEITHPASGQVTFNGYPIKGAQVVLTPVDPKIPVTVRPTGETDESGKFVLGTQDKSDGAPEGDYKVTVTWTPLDNSTGSPVRGSNLIPPQYSQLDQTQLQVKVAKGGSQFQTFEIRTQ